MKSEYLIKEGPYCYECGEYLGPEYSDGDCCIECWEKKNDKRSAPDRQNSGDGNE